MSDKMNIQNNEEHKIWLIAIKSKIAIIQVRIAVAVNYMLLSFYWELGKDISVKMNEGKWGFTIIDKLAADVQKELSGLKVLLSKTNVASETYFYLETLNHPEQAYKSNFK